MKYLIKYKQINESLLFKEKVQDFCEGNLAYLLDEGMRMSFDEYKDASVGVNLSFRAIGGIKWIDIKDYIIPFFERLSKKYIVKENFQNLNEMFQVEMEISPQGVSGTYEAIFTIDDIINEKKSINFLFLNSHKIKLIQFYIIK
jgi:hypothetical protein